MLFKNRQDAGEKLAHKLHRFSGLSDSLVLALPRGGVPVGFEVAKSLNAPLDIILVRKLGLPGSEELAIGAIASGGVVVMNESLVEQLGVSQSAIEAVKRREEHELIRRESIYRGGRSACSLTDKQIILVDDGLATGASMRAAVMAARESRPAKIIVAVPVAAEDIYAEFQAEVDEIVCYKVPYPFRSVGEWYEDFSQTTDAEVENLLEISSRNRME